MKYNITYVGKLDLKFTNIKELADFLKKKVYEVTPDPSYTVCLLYTSIQKLAGHNNVKTTMMYTHISDSLISKINSPLNSINL